MTAVRQHVKHSLHYSLLLQLLLLHITSTLLLTYLRQMRRFHTEKDINIDDEDLEFIVQQVILACMHHHIIIITIIIIVVTLTDR